MGLRRIPRPSLDLRGRIAPDLSRSTVVSRDDSSEVRHTPQELVRGDDSAERVRDGPVQLDRLDVLLDHRARVVDPQFGEQVRDLAALSGQDLVLRLELPELAFERPESLLARAVDELLVGLAGLALVCAVGPDPGFDLANVFAVVTPAPRAGNDAELARRIMLENGADEVEEREADA